MKTLVEIKDLLRLVEITSLIDETRSEQLDPRDASQRLEALRPLIEESHAILENILGEIAYAKDDEGEQPCAV